MARIKQPGAFDNESHRMDYLTRYDQVAGLWPVPSTEGQLATSFGTTHVRSSGNGTKLPLVLLHPLAGTSLSWAPLIEQLSADREVFAIDTIGTAGRSTQTKAIVDSSDLAAWLTEVIDQLASTPVHLVGYSNGAWHAALAALHHGNNLATVTLIEMGGGFVRVPLRTLSAFVSAGARPTPRNLARLDALIAPRVQTHPHEKELARAAMHFRGTLPWGSVLTDIQLQSIALPALIMFGSKTTIGNPERAVIRARKLMPHVETEIFNGAGHGLPFEIPHEVVTRFLQFTETHDR